MKKIFVLLGLFYSAASAQKVNFSFTDELQPAVFSLSMVMMHDVVNPPAASRYYEYCLLGAHAIAAANNGNIKPASTFIKTFPQISIVEKNNTYNHELAIIYCILETGKQMLPSGYQLAEQEEKLISRLQKAKVAQVIIDQSVTVAVEVAAQIVNYSKKDNYNKLSSLLRYTPSKKAGAWFPTPPQYMEAVEPHWNTIRTMVVDSAAQFKPLPLAPYSTDSTSNFFKLAKEVYTISKEQVPEHVLMANFWDCNPFFLATSGHMSLGFKKISPGAHWMNIGCIVAKKAKLNIDQSVEMLSIEAAAIMDAFICCWEEKFKSNRIRPETFINKHIDVRWQPILQTPPFPEYASGHSVISNAAAKVLTYLLGDGFAYTDDTEMMFDIPQRSFRSFNDAAEEAAISRLYGGIHYRDGVVCGQLQGKEIGDFIVEKIKIAGIMPLKH